MPSPEHPYPHAQVATNLEALRARACGLWWRPHYTEGMDSVIGYEPHC